MHSLKTDCINVMVDARWECICVQINKIEFQQSQQHLQQQENSQKISVGAVFNLIIYLVSLLLIVLQTMFGLFNPFMTTRYISAVPCRSSFLPLPCFAKGFPNC